MSKELLCFDYVLYDRVPVSFISRDAYTGIEFSDVEIASKCIRIFGTKEQIEKAEKNYNIDEKFSFKIETKGSYWYNIIKNPDEHNRMAEKKLAEYRELYKRNKNKVLILRTN